LVYRFTITTYNKRTKGEASKDFSKFKESEGEMRVCVSVSLGFAEAVPSRLLSTIHVRLEVSPTR